LGSSHSTTELKLPTSLKFPNIFDNNNPFKDYDGLNSMKKIEPVSKLPFGRPNGHTLWNWWANPELQGRDNIRYAFLVFDRGEYKVKEVSQQIAQSLGKNLGLVVSVETENPIGKTPVRVYESRDIFYGFFYAKSNKGNREELWMPPCDTIFVRYQGLEKQMDDVAIDRHARYISRRRGK
jgi:hypothetical protein